MLIVIAIIGILSAALIPRISSSKNKAINVATEKSIRDVTNALFLYYSDKGSYPIATTCNGTAKTDCSLSSAQSQLAQYLSSIPTPSYTLPAWSFGSGYQVPANQFGYVGLGSRYILSHHFVDTRDGKKYRVVNMPDSNRRMAENLNYKTNNSRCYTGDVICADGP
jgi:type II secretory pathway pseudopilin PulG